MNEIKLFFSLKRISYTLILFCGLFLISACSVKKKSRAEQNFIEKAYHNTTSKFNGYFNADVLLHEGMKTLNQQHQDNYTKILPVYEYVAADNPQAVAGGLDEAIKKVTVVVNIHPYSNWTDDCYLLAGKAQYIKKDYESAEETLEYMVREFSKEGIAAREAKALKATKGKKGKKAKRKIREKTKKEKDKERKKTKKAKKKKNKAKKKAREKEIKERKKARKKGKSTSKKSTAKKEKTTPEKTEDTAKKEEKKKEEKKKDKEESDNYFLKHKPAHQEGMLWLARTYIERESYDDAESLIKELEQNPNLFDHVQIQIPAVKAHFLLKQKQYEMSIAPLEEAIRVSKKKNEKARYAYIIGQIHQQAGRIDQAAVFFEDAKKTSNDYDMEFSASLNIIRSNWAAGKVNDADTEKALNKMLKDIKNEDYKDQIYYLLADLALKNKDKLAAIEHLENSLAFSTKNTAQKAESLLKLANLYFDEGDYIEAKTYFDQTLAVLPKTDERYKQVEEFANSLTDIAKNLQIIEEQDSLLRVSQMSEEEQKALVYKIKKEEDERKRANLLGDDTNSKTKGGVVRTTNPQDVKFWAYNDKDKRKGKRDFEKKWGNDRNLEDDWRRSNRRDASGLADDEEIAEVIDREMTDEEVKAILKGVPQTDEEIARANKMIDDAMFNLGTLYRDRLKKSDQTVQTLEALLKRYPKTEHLVEVWYFLHLAHTDLGNTAKAKEYFDKIVNEFPTSTYARVLTDPNFLIESQAQNAKLVRYYDETYSRFESGKFKEAYDRLVQVEKMFGSGNMLQPKFALLNAMCLGNIEGKDAYIKSLKEVIAKHPNTPEQTRAREILRLLGQESGIVKTEGGNTEDAKAKFKEADDKLHYFIVVLSGGEIKLSDAKNAVSDYNQQYFKLDKLRISNVYLGSKTGTPILVIRRFKTKTKAMAYYDTILKNGKDFLPEDVEYQMYPVTQHNYRVILKSKSLDGYPEFFEDNYLN